MLAAIAAALLLCGPIQVCPVSFLQSIDPSFRLSMKVFTSQDAHFVDWSIEQIFQDARASLELGTLSQEALCTYDTIVDFRNMKTCLSHKTLEVQS